MEPKPPRAQKIASRSGRQKKTFKVSGSFLVVPRQIAFAIMYSRSKLDLEPVLLQSLNASRQ